MKHTKLLYGFIAVLGIIFLAVFFPWPMFLFPIFFRFDFTIIFNATMQGLITSFFSIVGTVFLIAGICGITSSHFKDSKKISSLQSKIVGKSMVKHCRLFGFITVLGIAFLGVFFAILYWSGQSAELTRFFMSTPLVGLLLFIIFLFGGTAIFTVGICGILRHYFKHNQNLFTILAAILIPSLVLLPLCYLWLSPLTVGF